MMGLALLTLGGCALLLLAALALLARGLQLRCRRPQSGWRRLRVAGCERPTPDLLRLRLQARWGWRLPAFRPGQHLLIAPPARPGEARAPHRAYSLAQWSASPRVYELLIRRDPQGRVSSRLFDELRAGQWLSVGAARGHFHPGEDGSELVLVAGGVGITPMLAMAQWAAAQGRPFRLFWTVRHQAELVYAPELWALARRTGARLRLYVTGPDPLDLSPPWAGLLHGGRLAMADLPDPAERQLYLCAGAAFSAWLKQGLAAAGWLAEALHEEAFALALPGQGGPHEVGCGEQRLSWSGGSLLNLLESRPGLAPPAECRAGSCGSCRMRLLEGRVQWLLERPRTLASDEVLACACVPATALRLARPEDGSASACATDPDQAKPGLAGAQSLHTFVMTDG